MTDYVMYVAAIKLPPGKLAAQVSHAVLGLYRKITSNMEFAMIRHWWLNNDERKDGGTQAKIILKLENDMDANAVIAFCESAKIPSYVVVDAGRTVVEPGTRTAIAFGPVERGVDGPWKSMKLY